MSTEQQSPETLEEDKEALEPEAPPEASSAGEEQEAEDRSAMEELYAETLKNIEEGEIVKGTVVKVSDQEVLVDVGYKSEGSIPLREFRGERGTVPVAVGDEIEVFLEEAENSDGHIVLSKEKADKAKVWDEITKAYDNDREIEGTVTDKIKGGLAVDIGVRGFLPGSQVDLRPVRDLSSFVGQKITMKILKLNRQRGNIVLSRRAVLEKGREEKRRETLKKLFTSNIEKALTFLDDSLLPSTSNAVERGNRRHRKMQKSIYRVRTLDHISQRIAVDMHREAYAESRLQTTETLHEQRKQIR